MMQMRSNFSTFPLTLLKFLHFCRNAAGTIAFHLKEHML